MISAFELRQRCTKSDATAFDASTGGELRQALKRFVDEVDIVSSTKG